MSTTPSPALDPAEIGRLFRQESGRAVASLVGRFGDIDLAEEAVQEAFLEALGRWPEAGRPRSPAGWIIATARNRAIDRLRREASRLDHHAQAALLHHRDGPTEEGPVEDDRLRLIFTSCHPALATHARVALTLRLIAGLQTAEIARAFLIPEPTMAQRLVRAKRKIRAAKIPYRVPSAAELPGRLRSVLAVVYLVFNEGAGGGGGAIACRRELKPSGAVGEHRPPALGHLGGGGLEVSAVDAEGVIAERRIDEGAVVGERLTGVGVGAEVGAGHAHAGHRDPPLLLEALDDLDHGAKQRRLLLGVEDIEGGRQELGPPRGLGGGSSARLGERHQGDPAIMGMAPSSHQALRLGRRHRLAHRGR